MSENVFDITGGKRLIKHRLADKLDETIAAKRKVNFPTIADALEARQKLRETIAARVLLAGVPIGVAYSLWSGDNFGYISAGINFVGLIITCFIAGNRQYIRNTKGDNSVSSNAKRPRDAARRPF
jgi:hypothetical protein